MQTMKLRVQHENGVLETITLRGRVEVIEGSRMDRIHCEKGLDHYFTKSGFYDGWGGVVSEPEQAGETIRVIEAGRQIDSAPGLNAH